MATQCSFTEFEAKYCDMDFPTMLGNFSTWPEEVAINQIMAAMVRLIDLACDDERTPNEQKLKAAELAAVCEDTIRSRLSAEGNEAKLLTFENALAVTHDGLKRYALYPKIAELIIKKHRPHSGTFETGVVGEILARNQK